MFPGSIKHKIKRPTICQGPPKGCHNCVAATTSKPKWLQRIMHKFPDLTWSQYHGHHSLQLRAKHDLKSGGSRPKVPMDFQALSISVSLDTNKHFSTWKHLWKHMPAMRDIKKLNWGPIGKVLKVSVHKQKTKGCGLPGLGEMSKKRTANCARFSPRPKHRPTHIANLIDM